MADRLFEVERPGQAGEAVVLRCYLQPGAGRAAVVGRRGDALHVRVAPPPANGRANAALTELVASLFDVAPSAVTIASGERSRHKRVRISGVDAATADRRIDEALAAAAAADRVGARRRGAR
ncbi:MAG TPA: DUF167 family protein [Acidimicrobiales bacterium]|nr:DUF167 family protein [Acidimicrobiales bacterium]